MNVPEPPVVFDARNPALEAAILADPEAAEPWLIFGDWLQQQGDPRGVLIMRCAAQRAAPKDPKLLRMVEVRLDRYPEYFRGTLGKLGITLRWGFIHKLVMLAFDRGPSAPRLELCLRSQPHARFINTIELTVPDLERCIELIGDLAPSTLRSLAIVGTERVRDLEPLEHHLARLRQLSLIAGLSTAAEAALGRIAMPDLELLALRADDLAAVRARTDLPRLRELVIDHATPAVLEAIAGAPFAPQLHALGVRDLDSKSALYLLDNLARFPALATVASPHLLFDQSVAGTLRTRLELVGFLDRYSFSALSK